MSQFTVDPQAQSDMDEVWLYIARDNPAAADKLLNRFFEKFGMLGRQPLIGEIRDELLPGLRSFPVGNYVIFYFPFDEGARIARVLHGARDVNKIFDEA